MMNNNETGNENEKNIYGFCPICGANGSIRERKLNGNDICSAGHTYPSKNAIYPKKNIKSFEELSPCIYMGKIKCKDCERSEFHRKFEHEDSCDMEQGRELHRHWFEIGLKQSESKEKEKYSIDSEFEKHILLMCHVYGVEIEYAKKLKEDFKEVLEELRKTVLWGECCSARLLPYERNVINWRDLESARKILEKHGIE